MERIKAAVCWVANALFHLVGNAILLIFLILFVIGFFFGADTGFYGTDPYGD